MELGSKLRLCYEQHFPSMWFFHVKTIKFMCDVGLLLLSHDIVPYCRASSISHSLLINTNDTPLLFIVTAQNIPIFWNVTLKAVLPPFRTSDIPICSLSLPPTAPPAASYTSSRTLSFFRNTYPEPLILR